MRTACAALLLGAVLASDTWGQAIDPDKAQAWLERTFGIKSERVVEATPDSLVVLRTIEPRPPSDFHVIAHLENFAPSNPLTPPSSDEEYFVNCPSRRFHVERIENFSQSGGRGSQSTSFGPSGWGRAVPNSTEDRVVAAVCAPALAAPAALPESLPPPSAPVIADVRPLPAAPAKHPAPATKPAPPAVAKAGSARIQLFAGDRQAAQHFMDGLAGRLPAVARFGRPQMVEASSGGHMVYRVQVAGFASAAAAAQACSTVRAAGQPCFVAPDARR